MSCIHRWPASQRVREPFGNCKTDVKLHNKAPLHFICIIYVPLPPSSLFLRTCITMCGLCVKKASCERLSLQGLNTIFYQFGSRRIACFHNIFITFYWHGANHVRCAYVLLSPCLPLLISTKLKQAVHFDCQSLAVNLDIKFSVIYYIVCQSAFRFHFYLLVYLARRVRINKPCCKCSKASLPKIEYTIKI